MKTLRNILIALGVTFTAYVLIEGNNPTFSLPDWDLESFFTADDGDNSALYNQEMEDKDVYIAKKMKILQLSTFIIFVIL